MWSMAVPLAMLMAGCGGSDGGGGVGIAGLDAAAPTVRSTDPTDSETGVAINRNIIATFSEAMDPTTITSTTFIVIQQGVAAVPGTVTYVGTVAKFTLTRDLIPNSIATATITTGVTDLAGNAMAANKTWSFTAGATADTTPPTVISTSPANLATDVAINQSITATFSEAMDPTTITPTTFTVMQGITPIPGTVTSLGGGGAGGSVATFNPTSDFSPSSVVTVTITTGVTDLAGNALAANKTWSITTRP
ncbi:MAG TPA: Ig-like domain-containing protein [Nitrospiraceae bacterium]|nr:Ig-like domain-containing protein [Nitrospiraceae bacterium]